jgi:hypothetical protein
MGGSIGRVLYTADAYRNDGKRFTVIADEKLTAFLQLEESPIIALPKCQINRHNSPMQPFACLSLARARNRLQNAV